MRIIARKSQFRLLLVAVFIVAASIPSANAQLPQPDEKTQLEQELGDIESQIAAYQRELAAIKGEKNTLQNKINGLKKQQAVLGAQIRATNLQLVDTGNKITQTQSTIGRNTVKIQELKEQLAELIRLTHELDNVPLLYAILAKNNLSEVLSEVVYYSEVSEGIGEILKQTKDWNAQLAQDKQILEEQQDEAHNLIAIQSLQKEQLAGSVGEQNVLFDKTRGLESEYQAVLNDSQKQAAEIRNRLYQLLGINTQITFGEAVQIAKYASSMTGVRAAFLLAILTQESNLGQNVGTCNRPGDPPEKSWRSVMKPERDQPPFLTITSELGLDPETTPVSCPMRDRRGNRVGWGGAMGPAQFIPSTWMGYKDRVAAVIGKLANPWDIRDAFIASAIKLQAGGAGTVEGEWAAAMRYFSGSTNPRYRFYGDNVVKLANEYQADIDELNK